MTMDRALDSVCFISVIPLLATEECTFTLTKDKDYKIFIKKARTRHSVDVFMNFPLCSNALANRVTTNNLRGLSLILQRLR